MKTSEYFKERIIEMYNTCKHSRLVDPTTCDWFTNMVEDKWLNDGVFVSGEKMIFDMQSMEANFIRYPNIIYKYFVPCDLSFEDKKHLTYIVSNMVRMTEDPSINPFKD